MRQRNLVKIRAFILSLVVCAASNVCAQSQTTKDVFPPGYRAPRGCALAEDQELHFKTPREFIHAPHVVVAPPAREEITVASSSSSRLSFGTGSAVAGNDASEIPSAILIRPLSMYPPSGYVLLCGLHGFNDRD
jgi:hypothetical protein